jgi:8-oxo-dGTP pyrophosphatase MutT (NUDIX family)
LDYNEEPKDCCLRELEEETGLLGKTAELLTVKVNTILIIKGEP